MFCYWEGKSQLLHMWLYTFPVIDHTFIADINHGCLYMYVYTVTVGFGEDHTQWCLP